MGVLISYDIANTNMVSGTLTPGRLDWISCPQDSSGGSPEALIIQCTDWLKVHIYTPFVDWAATHDVLAGDVQVKGLTVIRCPVKTSALWIQNVHSSATVNYYITPLDGI